MTISLRTPTGLSSSTSTTQSIAETAGNPQPGDVRYLFVALADTYTLTGPTGWTSIYNAAAGTAGTMGLFRKNYVVGEGTQTVTFSSSTFSVFHVVSVAGANTAATPQSSTAGGTTGTTLTAPTITPTSANSLELAFFAVYDNTAGTTLSTPGGMSPLDFRQSPGALGETGSLVSRVLTTTAATGDAISTINHGSLQAWRAAMVVIAPAVGTVKTGQFLPFFKGF